VHWFPILEATLSDGELKGCQKLRNLAVKQSADLQRQESFSRMIQWMTATDQKNDLQQILFKTSLEGCLVLARLAEIAAFVSLIRSGRPSHREVG
jgi:hypothetical protein